MKYLGSQPNRIFFFLILLLAMILSCTSGNPIAALEARFFGEAPAQTPGER